MSNSLIKIVNHMWKIFLYSGYYAIFLNTFAIEFNFMFSSYYAIFLDSFGIDFIL